jgi:hypothetical protein
MGEMEKGLVNLTVGKRNSKAQKRDGLKKFLEQVKTHTGL